VIPARLHRFALRVAYRALLVYWRVWRPRTEGVCVAVWCDGALLLVQHTYKSGYGLPAGGRRRGEVPRDAAARELREEVGIVVSPAELLPAGHVMTRALGNEDHLDVFELQFDQEPKLRVDGREICSARFHARTRLTSLDLLPGVRAWLDAGPQSTDSAV
jgi:8-oxo-dGTP pyrophosphatase MutT (NUDIX family)